MMSTEDKSTNREAEENEMIGQTHWHNWLEVDEGDPKQLWHVAKIYHMAREYADPMNKLNSNYQERLFSVEA